MGNYANILSVFNCSDEQLLTVQSVLEHAHAAYAELGPTFFIKTNSGDQERAICDALNTLPITYTFAHVEHLEATYVRAGKIDSDKLRQIRGIFFSEM